MKTYLFSTIKKFVVLTLILGLFAIPGTASADWTDIFGDIFGGNNNGNSNSSYTYDNYGSYNSTTSQSQGKLEMSKRVRVVGQDNNYHEQRNVYSGALVEIKIEVKNESRYAADVVVTDELGGSTVYKTGSLSINGSPTNLRGLTSGGLPLNIPAKGRVVITYQMYVCSGTSYPVRASAYAAGIGTATDAVIISTENDYQPYGSYNHVGTCMNQYQNQTTNNSSYNGPSITYQAGNPFGGWTGVNNATATTATANNPFSGWTGVNNSAQTASAANNPFAGWTGVNNASAGTSSSTTNSPFGTWTGVNNSETTSNPFGDWYGSSRATTNSDPFGTWTGVSNSDSVNNPFGDWTGVNNDNTSSNTSLAYNSQGYSSSTGDANTNNARPSTYTQTTNFVAPTTGVSKTAPIIFAGMLTAAFLVFRNRKLIFS